VKVIKPDTFVLLLSSKPVKDVDMLIVADPARKDKNADFHEADLGTQNQMACVFELPILPAGWR
jgi:hypothetical protein